MNYLLIAGEASGDEHGARLIASLREIDEKASFAFVGGDKMQGQAGIAPLYHYREIAVMGVSGVLRSMGRIRRAAHSVQQFMRSAPLDVVIPIDYGGFNLRYVLPIAHRLGLPVAYYIPPKVWASRRRRVKQLRCFTDLCMTILPFESDYLTERGVNALYVGNPSIQSVGSYYGSHPRLCSTDHPYIALLPGSRTEEIRRNLQVMCQTIERLPGSWRAIIAQAPGQDRELYTPYIDSSPRISIMTDDTYQLLARASAALVTSGTATLEATLIGTPQVVCYKLPGGSFARWAVRHLLPITYFSLSNLILDRPVVEELLGGEVTPQRLVAALLPLLDCQSVAYQRQQDLYDLIRRRLACSEASASTVAARSIYSQFHRA
jgi:lipid-A-disaccharide synthase